MQNAVINTMELGFDVVFRSFLQRLLCSLSKRLFEGTNFLII